MDNRELRRIEGDGFEEETSEEDEEYKEDPGSYEGERASAPEASDSHRSRWQMLTSHVESVRADLFEKMLNVGPGDEGKKFSASKVKLSDIISQYQAEVEDEEAVSNEQRIAHDGDHEISEGETGKHGTIPLSEWHRIIVKLDILKDTPRQIEI